MQQPDSQNGGSDEPENADISKDDADIFMSMDDEESDITTPEKPADKDKAKTVAKPGATEKKDKDTKENAPLIKGAQHFDQEPDILDKNYQIFPLDSQPDLDNSNARAVKAIDRKNPSRQVYALICKNNMPNRRQTLEKLGDFSHRNLLKPLAHGIIPLSSPNECRYVMVLERPPSISLEKLLESGEKVDERFILKEVIMPLAQILEAFQQKECVHGKINLKNLYYNEQGATRIILGECFSEPCGSTQDEYFLPPDIAVTNPIGRGEEDPRSDYFALGIVALRLILGFNPVQKLDKNEYFEKCMSQGVFNTVVGNRELPSMMDDLLKGLLTDERENRWGAAQINLWLSGKRFNLLRPTPPKESSRPYLFSDKPHFNKRHLAFSLFNNWNQAKVELRDKRVARWLELSTKNPDLADKMAKVVQMTGGDISRLATDDDDLVSKSITLLNPYSSFRLPKFSSFLSGFGPTLAESVQSNNMYIINCIMRLMYSQSIEPWTETSAASTGFNSASIAWLIESRARIYQSKMPGFGTDRVLYDLNPSLPCQSPLVIKHHVTSAGELLLSLDSVTSERHRLSEPFDRHVLAFIASKLNITQDLRTPLDRFPKFSKNGSLRALSIYAMAQRRVGNIPLHGLCKWLHERLRPALDNVHSRSLKTEMKEELERAAPKGNLAAMLKIFSNPDAIAQDEEGFQKAKIRYSRNAMKIAELNQHGTTDDRAMELGMRVSVLLGMASFFLTVVKLTQQHLFSFG